jgi:hypothetical protein
VGESVTVSELDKMIRRAFNGTIEGKDFVKGVKMFAERNLISQPGAAQFNVSNIGYFETTAGIEDVSTELWVPAITWTEVVTLTTLTTFGGKNDCLKVRYPYSPLVFTRTDAVRALKMITHSLQNINPKMKVVDAIRELREVKA